MKAKRKMQNIILDKIKIGHGHPCFIISEIGGMYEDLDGMKELIRISKEAGVDAVKLQTYRAETISLAGAEFEFEDGSRMSQFDFFKQYEISRGDHKILFDYALEQGITIFSTPSYYDDVDFLEELGVEIFKTGSDDLTNYPFLDYLARKGRPMIVSTGMATLAEVEAAVETILKTGNDQLALLHCTASYPPRPEFANLNIVKTLRQAFDLPVGYSDHIPGVFCSVLAASMGACIIEKHVTLDRGNKRPDYQVSLEPAELKEMVEQIRLTPVLQGSSVKKVYPPEEKWRRNSRKSLTAARNIKVGQILQVEDVKVIRPGTGLSPDCLELIIGRKVKEDINEDQLISFEAL